jgi:hypothetical protein
MHILRGFSIVQIPANRAIDKKSQTTHGVTFTMSHSATRLSFRKKKIVNEGQWEISRPVAFRLHLTMNLALYRGEISSQQGNYALLGARHIHLRCFDMR